MEQYSSAAIDVSCFLVMEDSGDSEVDSYRLMDHVDYEDDDAESCSCDSDSSFLSNLYGCDDGDHKDYDNYEVEAHDIDDDDDEMDIQGYCDQSTAYNRCADEQRSVVSATAVAEESMNESEKNRLFWEACLAS